MCLATIHAQIQNHSLLCSSLLPMMRALVMVVVEEMVVVVKVVVAAEHFDSTLGTLHSL